MNNLMKYKGYYGSSSISFEDGVMHGKLECINDLVTYEGATVAELRAAFEEGSGRLSRNLRRDRKIS